MSYLSIQWVLKNGLKQTTTDKASKYKGNGNERTNCNLFRKKKSRYKKKKKMFSVDVKLSVIKTTECSQTHTKAKDTEFSFIHIFIFIPPSLFYTRLLYCFHSFSLGHQPVFTAKNRWGQRGERQRE